MKRMNAWFLAVCMVCIAIAIAARASFAQGDAGAAAADTAGAGEAPGPGGSFGTDFFIARIVHADESHSIDWIGTSILWLLLALSMVNVGLILHLAFNNTRKVYVPADVISGVKMQLGASHFREALDLLGSNGSFFARILHAGLSEAGHGYSAMMRAMEQASDVITTQRMRPIEVLYMFGQVSPMIGLLGTVYGIIFAFRVFVSMGGHASPSLLAAGIGTALVATFWGLVVAIPALAGYSMLRNKVDQLSLQATVQAEEILAQFKPKPPGGGKPGASPMPAPAVKVGA